MDIKESENGVEVVFDATKEDQEIYRHLLLLSNERNMTIEEILNTILEESLNNPEIMNEIENNLKEETK